MCIKKLFLLPALLAASGLILTGRSSAQSYSNLHVFTNYPADGANPQGSLIVSGNMLYGTTSGGGNQTSLSGTVFKINTDGSGFTNFYFFPAVSEPGYPHTNSNGAFPEAGLVLSGNTLYGTAYGGGTFGLGTIFRVNTDGSGFANLHTFTNGTDGANPEAGLVLSGNMLYGTATGNDSANYGTVFALGTNGAGFTMLHTFTNGTDGAIPLAGLILAGGTLYGTTTAGASGGNGTVFAINTNGTGFTNLYSFSAGTPNDEDIITNGDGANPEAGLILVGNTLYGTANDGGLTGNCAVFAVSTNGTSFTNLYSFTDIGDYGPNSDGALPQAGLISVGSTLYGTAADGGSSASGTVFAINTDGTDLTNLYSFNGFVNSGGDLPLAGLVLSGGTLFGTTFHGGDGVDGVVFSLSVTLPAAPQLTITHSGNGAIVSWPESVTGWTLQTNQNLGTGAWGDYAGPVINNIATNSPLTGKLFFRLSSSP